MQLRSTLSSTILSFLFFLILLSSCNSKDDVEPNQDEIIKENLIGKWKLTDYNAAITIESRDPNSNLFIIVKVSTILDPKSSYFATFKKEPNEVEVGGTVNITYKREILDTNLSQAQQKEILEGDIPGFSETDPLRTFGWDISAGTLVSEGLKIGLGVAYEKGEKYGDQVTYKIEGNKITVTTEETVDKEVDGVTETTQFTYVLTKQ